MYYNLLFKFQLIYCYTDKILKQNKLLLKIKPYLITMNQSNKFHSLYQGVKFITLNGQSCIIQFGINMLLHKFYCLYYYFVA